MPAGTSSKEVTWESRFQSIAMAILLALSLWMGSSVYDAQISIAKINERDESSRSQIMRLVDQVDRLAQDRYTGTQAAVDFSRVNRDISEIIQELGSVRDRLRDVEREVDVESRE